VNIALRKRVLKLYGIIVFVDLLLYIGIFYCGRAIPPASPYTSYPGNYSLCMGWLLFHLPASFIFFAGFLPDGLAWLPILQDIWLALFIVWIWRRKNQ
jgi:Na+-driven multidrug efflux pump